MISVLSLSESAAIFFSRASLAAISGFILAKMSYGVSSMAVIRTTQAAAAAARFLLKLSLIFLGLIVLRCHRAFRLWTYATGEGSFRYSSMVEILSLRPVASILLATLFFQG